jgi:hypothetical protein
MAGLELSNSIDETTNPCNDFYLHACGGWIERNPVPPTAGGTSVVAGMSLRLAARLKGKEIPTKKVCFGKPRGYDAFFFFFIAILEEERETSASDSLGKSAVLYQSCLDLSKFLYKTFKINSPWLKSN